MISATVAFTFTHWNAFSSFLSYNDGLLSSFRVRAGLGPVSPQQNGTWIFNNVITYTSAEPPQVELKICTAYNSLPQVSSISINTTPIEFWERQKIVVVSVCGANLALKFESTALKRRGNFPTSRSRNAINDFQVVHPSLSVMQCGGVLTCCFAPKSSVHSLNIAENELIKDHV